MDRLFQDLRQGVRSLRRSRGFTAVATLTLGLGIGANTAIFSVLDRVVLNPAPWPEADRLVAVGWSWGGSGGTTSLTPAKAAFWKEQTDLFEAATITRGASFVLTGGDAQPEHLTAVQVSDGYFRATRMAPALGRAFLAEENEAGGPKVAVLSDGLWHRRFGADPGVAGRTITLSGEPYTVIGVMPPEFGATGNDLITPLQLVVDPHDQGHNEFFFARLAPGVTFQEVEATLDAMTERFRATAPYEIGPQEHFRLLPYREVLVAGLDTVVWILFGAVGFVLLIACANVANLLLGRAAARESEIAIRTALGAGRGRILRHLMTESVLLALAGAGAALVLAAWLLDALVALAPPGIPNLDQVGLNLPVLGFTLAVALLTGLAVGLAGAVRAMRPDLVGALKEGGRARTDRPGRLRGRGFLVMGEAALSVVLLVGAALLIVSFFQLRGVELGFQPEGVYTAELRLPPERYGTTAETWAFERRVIERIEGLPGVGAVGSASSLPLVRGLNIGISVAAPGPPTPASSMEFRAVSPGYLRAIGATVLEGRVFTASDDASALPVAVVNETFVEGFARAFPDREPIDIGTRISVGGGPERTVVGVLRDVRDIDLDQEARPTVFAPRAQVADGLTRAMNGWFPIGFAVRTDDPDAVAGALRRAVDEADPLLPILRMRPMTEVVAASVAAERFNMTLLGAFAGLALLLTAIGIYGVVSYAARQRTHEMGVRMALGARAEDVVRLVLGQGMRVVLIGLGIGLVAAFALTRLLASMVYGVSTSDPATFIAVAALLAVVALVAVYVPARRATRVDPMIALRAE